ncbi:MAG TPA: toxin-antitoxin system HicB family antitoxin [Verrucomicrobiae bacterium]
MTAINVKLPDSIARKAGELAAKDGVSFDQFISAAVAEKISGWLTEDDLDQRARRASREKYDEALAQVPDAPPVPGDEL